MDIKSGSKYIRFVFAYLPRVIQVISPTYLEQPETINPGSFFGGTIRFNSPKEFGN